MNGPQKEEKIKKNLKDELHEEVGRLKKRKEEVTTVQGVVVDETSQRDVLKIMRNNHTSIHQQFSEGTVQRIFFGTSNCRLQRWEISDK